MKENQLEQIIHFYFKILGMKVPKEFPRLGKESGYCRKVMQGIAWSLSLWEWLVVGREWISEERGSPFGFG